MALMTSNDFRLFVATGTLKLLPIVAHAKDFCGPLMAALDQYHGAHDSWWNYYSSSWQQYADTRLAALDTAEHLVYKLLDLERDRLRAMARPRVFLMHLLAQIQQAHVELISIVHRKSLTLWVHERSKLSSQQATQLDADWEALSTSAGAVVMPDGDPFVQGRRELRSIHARLLSRPQGRALLRAILDETGGRWTVEIVFTPYIVPNQAFLNQVTQNRQAQLRLRDQIERLTEEDLRLDAALRKIYERRPQGPQERRGAYVERLKNEDDEFIGLWDLNERTATALDRAKGEFAKYGDPDHQDYAVSVPEPGAASKDSGRKSKLRMRTGLRDDIQRNYDKAGHPIPAPAFIVYGHELIHVLQHRTPDRMVLDPAVYNPQHGKAQYHNSVEHETIRSLSKLRGPLHIPFYENLLRDEHKLTLRKYHTGLSSFDLGEDQVDVGV